MKDFTLIPSEILNQRAYSDDGAQAIFMVSALVRELNGALNQIARVIDNIEHQIENLNQRVEALDEEIAEVVKHV